MVAVAIEKNVPNSNFCVLLRFYYKTRPRFVEMIASESSNDSSSGGEGLKEAQNSAFSAARQKSSNRVVQKNRGRRSILKKKAAANDSANDSLEAEIPEKNSSEISRVKTRSQMKKKPNRSEIVEPPDVPGLFMIDRNPNASESATASSSSVVRTFPRKSTEQFSTKNQKRYGSKIFRFFK